MIDRVIDHKSDPLSDAPIESVAGPPTGALPAPVAGAGGGGKGGGGSASTTPDTLFSTATIRLVDLVAEGEIVGVRGGLKGVYLNDVPVQNADGTFNFKGLTAEFRTGTPDQTYMAGYPDVQTPRSVGRKVDHDTPVTESISDTAADRVRVTVQVPALFLSKSDGTVTRNSVSYQVEACYSGGPWINALGDQTIAGKTTSGYFRSHEITLPRNTAGASAPWQVRVVRISGNTDDFNNSQSKYTNQSDLIFHSLTTITDAKFAYPGSALVGLTAQASVFGSSVPGRTYLVDGVLMPVPSNYDPVARTYAGIWDGTFKPAFSNNPAWALHLVLTDDRFGLGQFIDVAAVDKWSLYEIGRYCDVMVADGKGGQEPRFTFNGVVSSQQEAFELLQLVAQVFQGAVYWSSGTVTATQDRPADPVLLVSEANVVDGAISYASSGRKARHTVAIVAWNDPTNLYKTEYEVVEDAEGVARYGYNPTKVDLLGCTSRGQAHRAGLWRLFTELQQTQVATYRAGLDHAVARPGDIVAIQDPQIADLDLSGRLLAGSTATSLVLDRTVTLLAGAAYRVSVALPDGTVREVAVAASASGDLATLPLASALPAAPDPAAVWVIAGPVEPRLFRIVSIREDEPHIYAVTALQHEPGKYAAIDSGAPFVPTPISTFPTSVDPPTNLSVRESQYTDLGQPRQALTLSWTPGQPFNSVGYYVTAIRPSGAILNLPRSASTSVDFADAETGAWTFFVTAIGLDGKTSIPAQIAYAVVGWAGQAPTTVTDLAVLGGGATFSGRSCTLVWTNVLGANVSPYPVRNVVTVSDASSNAILHREMLAAEQTRWTYDYQVNVNEGGPRRQFRVAVSALSPLGAEGPPTSLLVANPPPALVTPTLDHTSESAFVSIAAPSDPDWAGFLIWFSKTPGFNPLTTAPTADTASTFTVLKGDPDATYFVRVAAYDAFGKDPASLNISAEQSVKLTILLFDPSAPTAPGKPMLATAAETASDGTVTSHVSATWAASTGNFADLYEVAVSEAGGGFVVERVNGAAWEHHGFRPNITVEVKVRAISKNGFAASGYGTSTTITTAASTAVPDNPGSPSVAGTYQGASLTWTAPSARDLAYVEVWSVDGASAAANPPGGAVLRARVGSGSTAWWDTTIGAGGQRTYWLRSRSTSDVYATGYTAPVTATNALITGGVLQAGIIDATKFAAGLTPTEIVDTLPTTGNFVGRQAVLKTDGKLYRYTSGGWTAAVAAADVTGTLADGQIAGIAGTKIAGVLSPETIGFLNANKSITGIVASQIANVNASAINGQITDGQIQGLTAAKLTTQITSTQITDGAITTQKIGASQVLANNIAAGAVTASKLQVASTNLLQNADYAQGYANWTNDGGNSGFGLSAQGTNTTNAPSGMMALRWLSAGVPTAAGTVAQLYYYRQSPAGTLSRHPVTAGIRYEFSVYVSTLRCQALASIIWYDASNNPISTSDGNTVPYNNGLTAANPIATWNAQGRSGVIATAPASAVSCLLRVRYGITWGTGSAPEVHVSGVMFSVSDLAQTELSPYVDPGVTTINGAGILTGSIGATSIVANSITTTQLQVSTIFADNAVVNLIRANSIDATTITARLLGVQFVTAANVYAGAITASKLAVASANLLQNGDFAQGTGTFPLVGGASSGLTVTASIYPASGYQGSSSIYCVSGTAATAATNFFLSAQRQDAAGVLSNYPLTAGTVVEFSFQYVASNCTVAAIVSCFGSAGLIQNLTGATLSGAGRASVIGTLPAGTTSIRPVFYASVASGATPAVIFSQGMLAVGYAGQTEVSPYVSPSVTMIEGGTIRTGTVKAAQLNATEIFGNSAVLNSISTGVLTSGAIKATMIDGGAVTADKLGVGLNTGNLIWNSDQVLAGWYTGVSASVETTSPSVVPNFAIGGTSSLRLFNGGTPPSGGYAYLDLTRPLADGTRSSTIPVQAGRTIELSAYVSSFRCDGALQAVFFNSGGGQISYTDTNRVSNSQVATGVPADGWRARLTMVVPANAVSMAVRVVQYYTGGGTPDVYFSGFYLGYVPAGTTAYSIYAPQSNTVIDGGQVSTNSLDAVSIKGTSITGDKIRAGAIAVGSTIIADGAIRVGQLATDVLTASNITISGATKLSSWQAGGDVTKINGGAIYANSITTNALRVGSRNVQMVGISFNAERNASGVLTGVVKWTAGSIILVTDGGMATTYAVAAGQATVDAGNWFVWWDKTVTGGLGCAKDYGEAILNNSNCILIATISGYVGISTLIGGTIIDGTRITTLSIQANQIASDAIQTRHMTAGTISGDRITTGTLAADRITSGTITVGAALNVGNPRTILYSDGNGGRFACYNNEMNAWRLACGELSPWTGTAGDYGLMAWGADNALKLKVASSGTVLDGAIINNLTVGNLKIANGAISQMNGVIATSTTNPNNTVSISYVNTRNQNVDVLIIGEFDPSATGSFSTGAACGNLQIVVDESSTTRSVTASTYVAAGSFYLSGMCYHFKVNLAPGSHTFRVTHTNNLSQGRVSVYYMELSK